MKVIHNPSVNYFRGQSGGYVFYGAPSRLFSIARNYRYPTITPENNVKGAEMQGVRNCWVAAHADFKSDMQIYAATYYQENLNLPDNRVPVNNSFGNFFKCLYLWYLSDPTHIDLTEITPEDIMSATGGPKNVKDAVELGYLPTVTGYDLLDNPIDVA